jgi:hypothetical protein
LKQSCKGVKWKLIWKVEKLNRPLEPRKFLYQSISDMMQILLFGGRTQRNIHIRVVRLDSTYHII